MTLRVHWETLAALAASGTAAALLALRAAGFRFASQEQDAAIVEAAFAFAALLAAGFGVIASAKLRASPAGRALSLFMSVLAVVLVTPVAGPLPVPFGVLGYLAVWGSAGALILLSFRLAGVATPAELAHSRELTTLACLVRPRQVAWVMERRVAAWWAGLPLFLLLYALLWTAGDATAVSSSRYALVIVLFSAVAALLLTFMGAALSNVAARASVLDARSWRATRWLLWAVLASALCFVISSVPALLARLANLPVLRWVSMGLMVAAPLALVLGVILAVVGFGAVDPSLALRRTASLGITGMVWVAVSALGEDLVTQRLSKAVAVPGTASWVVVIGAALLLAPLQRWIERRFESTGRESTGRESTGRG